MNKVISGDFNTVHQAGVSILTQDIVHRLSQAV